jgi:PAT family beta-lactamase induction signal transducer AmpG
MAPLPHKNPSFWSLYNDRRVLVMGIIGFSCGIPLFLTASTFTLWLNQVGISYTKVGLVSLVALPYTIKFVWAPFVDRLKLPFLTRTLGRRRAWLLLSQISLVASITALSLTNPAHNLFLTCVCAIWVSFSSATQDIIMLAYQVERLEQSQYGEGAAMGIFGYRMGMLLSGAGALYFSEFLDWGQVYQLMALFVLVGVATTLFIKEPTPVINEETRRKEQMANLYIQKHPHIPGLLANGLSWLYAAVVCPFSDYMARSGWVVGILIMLFYKLGDNLIGNMANIFYTEVGFSKSEIASVSKIFGMATTIIGGFLGGFLIARLGILKSLFISALVHGVSILFFVLIAHIGYNLNVFYLSIAIEHVTGGMRTIALFAFQMTLVSPIYAATQLALLTSAVHLGRILTASLSGTLVSALGWTHFFSVCTASTVLSLILVAQFAKIKETQDLQKVPQLVGG